LACANAIGDMASSLYVGYLLDNHQAEAAFGIAAFCGAIGVLWLMLMKARVDIAKPA
jgi:dipeptide/tripeptide permease